jgi:O-antigen ligase
MTLRSKLATASLFGLLTATGLFYATPEPLVERLAQHTSEGRLSLWKGAISMVGQYPLLGCGLGGFENAFLKFKVGWSFFQVDYAHNDYLQFLAEMGIAGFLIGAVLIGFVSIRAMRCTASNSETRWLALACVASLTAIGVHSFVDFNLYVACNAAALSWICGLSTSLERSSAMIQGDSRTGEDDKCKFHS